MNSEQKKNTSGRQRTSAKHKSAKKSGFSGLFLIIVLAVMALFLFIVCHTLSPDKQAVSADSTNTSADISGSSASQTQTQTESPSDTDTVKTLTSTNAPASTTTATAKEANVNIDDINIITIDEDNWQLTLVNKNYRLPDGYTPPELVSVGNDCTMDSRVAPYYIKMYNAALADGVTLTPYSGYRSYDCQSRNYNNKINYYVNMGYDEENAAVKASTIIMPPGSSEHNLGFAMDIVTCDNWFEDTDEFTWLRENAYKYGFIMRYAEEKTDITGVIYEPWHWRYVGVDAATEIYNTRDANGVEICLEEYLNEY